MLAEAEQAEALIVQERRLRPKPGRSSRRSCEMNGRQVPGNGERGVDVHNWVIHD
jgi:hypothetical protein